MRFNTFLPWKHYLSSCSCGLVSELAVTIFCCNWAWLNRLKDKNAIWSKSSTYNNYILSPFHAYNVSWCQPIRNKMVFIVALLQTLINEGMPLSVDMRNLRSIYIYYCTTFTMGLGLVLYWFYSKQVCKRWRCSETNKRTCSHLFIQIHGTNNMFHVILDQTPQHALMKPWK